MLRSIASISSVFCTDGHAVVLSNGIKYTNVAQSILPDQAATGTDMIAATVNKSADQYSQETSSKRHDIISYFCRTGDRIAWVYCALTRYCTAGSHGTGLSLQKLFGEGTYEGKTLRAGCHVRLFWQILRLVLLASCIGGAV